MIDQSEFQEVAKINQALNPMPLTERTKIPPKTFWDIEETKRNNFYFYFKEIEETKPNGHVMVKDHGDMIMLGGYSYLGLGGHPEINQAAKDAIDKYTVCTEGSRLLAGTLTLHRELEEIIASFKGTEDAVTFSSGYVANVSTISSLLRRNDLIFCDKMNHASILDGCLSSRAHMIRFAYNNADALENELKKITTPVRKLVVVDAVYSMEGSIVDLPKINHVCKKYGAYLMVDEAHSVGVLGETGSGVEEYYNMPKNTIDIKMGTLSKTIPSSGGYIAGSYELIEFIKHEARGFIYSGSPSAPTVASALEAFRVIMREPERIQELQKKSTFFRDKLNDAGFNTGDSQTPIVPIIIGEFNDACMLAQYCQEHGIYIHAIVPPVVPAGTARLRGSVTVNNSYEDLAYSVDVMSAGVKALGLNLSKKAA